MRAQSFGSAVAVCCALFAAAALAWCLHFTASRMCAAYLSQGDTASALEHAIRLDPRNSDLLLLEADLAAPGEAAESSLLRQAASLSPLDAAPWMRLGLAAEARGELASAEHYLLEAARVSRLYQPRWTLANFYFRRGANREFWHWTRAALELSPRDPRPLFDLAWRMSSNGEEVVSKAIPNNSAVLARYAAFLLDTARLDAAERVIAQLGADPTPENRNVLLDASDRFIADGRIEAAIAAWNAVCAGKSAHCHALEPGEGLGVGFDPEIGGRGFSWHMPRTAGVSGTLQPDVATVNFSGTESDQVETLWRMIPVKSSAKYALDFEYQTRDIAPGSGLVWQVTSVAGARPKALAASPHLSKFGWTRESLSFSTDPEVHLVRVSLAYSRPPGQVHIKGTVFTRAVAVRPTT